MWICDQFFNSYFMLQLGTEWLLTRRYFGLPGGLRHPIDLAYMYYEHDKLKIIRHFECSADACLQFYTHVNILYANININRKIKICMNI